MTHEITQADKVAAEGWAREQSPGLQMMLVKPRGLHEAFAAHRIAHEAPLLAENERLRLELFGQRAAVELEHLAEMVKMEARIAELEGTLTAIVAMQALRFGDATGTHLALAVLCETARVALEQEPGT